MLLWLSVPRPGVRAQPICAALRRWRGAPGGGRCSGTRALAVQARSRSGLGLGGPWPRAAAAP